MEPAAETSTVAQAAEIGTLAIPNELLHHFNTQPLPEGVTRRDDPVFVEALNACLVGQGTVALDESSIDVRSRLRRAMSKVTTKYKNAKGRMKETVLK